MFGIIPVLCFVFFVVIYAVNSSAGGVMTRWRVSFLAGAVTWGLAVTAMTEVLCQGKHQREADGPFAVSLHSTV